MLKGMSLILQASNSVKWTNSTESEETYPVYRPQASQKPFSLTQQIFSYFNQFSSLQAHISAASHSIKKALNKYIYLNFKTWRSSVLLFNPTLSFHFKPSSWEPTRERLEYWGAAVVVNGQAVADTVHLLPPHNFTVNLSLCSDCQNTPVCPELSYQRSLPLSLNHTLNTSHANQLPANTIICMSVDEKNRV